MYNKVYGAVIVRAIASGDEQQGSAFKKAHERMPGTMSVANNIEHLHQRINVLRRPWEDHDDAPRTSIRIHFARGRSLRLR